MSSNIMKYEDFLELGYSEQRKQLIEYRKRFKNVEIAKAWGISIGRFTYLVNKLNVPKFKELTDRRTKQILEGKLTLEEHAEELAKKLKQPKQEILIPIGDGLNLQVKGEYVAAEIQSKLERFALVLEDDKRYKIQLAISEVTKDK